MIEISQQGTKIRVETTERGFGAVNRQAVVYLNQIEARQLATQLYAAIKQQEGTPK